MDQDTSRWVEDTFVSSWNRNGPLLHNPSRSFASHQMAPTKKTNDSLSWLQMWGPFVKIFSNFPRY